MRANSGFDRDDEKFINARIRCITFQDYTDTHTHGTWLWKIQRDKSHVTVNYKSSLFPADKTNWESSKWNKRLWSRWDCEMWFHQTSIKWAIKISFYGRIMQFVRMLIAYNVEGFNVMRLPHIQNTWKCVINHNKDILISQCRWNVKTSFFRQADCSHQAQVVFAFCATSQIANICFKHRIYVVSLRVGHAGGDCKERRRMVNIAKLVTFSQATPNCNKPSAREMARRQKCNIHANFVCAEKCWSEIVVQLMCNYDWWH